MCCCAGAERPVIRLVGFWADPNKFFIFVANLFMGLMVSELSCQPAPDVPDRHRQTDRQIHRDTQTHRPTDTQTHRHTDILMVSQLPLEMSCQPATGVRDGQTQTHRHTDTQTHRPTDPQTDRQTDRQR